MKSKKINHEIEDEYFKEIEDSTIKLKEKVKTLKQENANLKVLISALRNLELVSFNNHILDSNGERVKQICEAWNIKPQELILPIRGKSAVNEARQIVMFALKHETRLSHDQIGECLGERDHSTVTHSIKKVNELATVDKSYRNKLTALNLEKWLITK